MALKFPDILQHNNSSSYALIDASELRGTTHTITNLNQTGSLIPTDKRNTGTIVFVTSEQKYYGYYGATNSSTDWNTISNWKQISDGVNANNLNAITTGSTEVNQTISGSLTVLGGIFATASFATSSISASFAQTSSFVLDGFTSASARLNRLTLFRGNGTTSSITINTGSSGISISDIIGASSEGQFLYNFLGGGIAGDNSLVIQNGLLTATGSFYGVFYGDDSTDVDFIGTASWAESASFALSVSAITSSYPFNISNNNIFSAGANKLDDIELPINGEHNFSVGDGSAIRSIYTHSISIGYKSGFREQNYVGSEISPYGNIFLGSESGYTINNDDYVKSSFFALYRAGRDTSAENSIFLGREAGIKSKHANNSVFIGTKSGVLQQNASHSIFIGFKAGSTIDYASGDQTDITVLNESSLNAIIKNPLGRNNIIVGTNITLPANTNDSINIGGILFGSGTYFNLDDYPLEYPVQNGKIGINKYPTNYNLEVSGTTNITNGLYVTNSINLSGSNNHTGNYILTGSILSTGSNTFVGNTIVSGTLETSGSTIISGSLNILNNLVVLGSASFNVFTTTYTTTSVIVATGSNILGDTVDDTQTFVGAVSISGSLAVTGSTFLTASNVVGGQNNYLALWSGNNSLTTGSLYETSSNILIGTNVNPNNNFKLYVSGNIGLPAYQISSITSSSNPNSIGIWRPAGNSGYTNFLETTTSESKYNFVFRGIDGFGVKRNWEENNSAIVNINLGWGEPTQTLWTASALLIDPHISKSNGNAALIRGIYYNPIVTASANTTLVAIETTTGSIIFRNLPTSSTVQNVLLYDSTSGQLFYTASSGVIGGGGSAGTGSNATGSFTTQSVWTFNHNLNNKYVLVQTYDTNWNQIIPETITLTDTNTTTISFPTSESGYAIAMLGGDTSVSLNSINGGTTITGALTLVSGSGSDKLIKVTNTANPTSFIEIASEALTINAGGYGTSLIFPQNANSSGDVRLPANPIGQTLVSSVNGVYANDDGDVTLTTIPTASYVNTLNQNLIISGNILPAGPYTANTSSYSLGSATAAWKDIYVSNGSVIFLSGSTSSSINLGPAGTLNFTGSLQGTASFAQTASFVNTLNQNVLITGSLTVGLSSAGPSENTLTLGARDITNEGGQIGFNAPGGTYTSASFIDNYQDQFRILKGQNANGSTGGCFTLNLRDNSAQFFGAVTASAYSGLPNDYLYVTRNTNQTIGSGTWANRDVVFNNSVVSKGISYNTGTGLATLTGGKIYRITARLAWSAAGVYLLQFSCYDSSNSQLGPTIEIVQSTNSSNNISDGTLDFIYAPGSNVDIKIRTTNNTSALSGEFIRGDLNTQLIIQQIA